MTEVLDMAPAEALDRRRERPAERKEKEKSVTEDRKRDRDSRERRDDRDDRPPRRGDYKRRHSPSPPPYVPRDRRHSPPSRRSPPYKRSRRDDAYDNRRGSPRGGFNSDDRRHMAEKYW